MIQGFTHVTPLKTALVTMNFLTFAQHISTINKNLNQPEPGLPRGPCILYGDVCMYSNFTHNNLPRQPQYGVSIFVILTLTPLNTHTTLIILISTSLMTSLNIDSSVTPHPSCHSSITTLHGLQHSQTHKPTWPSVEGGFEEPEPRG